MKMQSALATSWVAAVGCLLLAGCAGVQLPELPAGLASALAPAPGTAPAPLSGPATKPGAATKPAPAPRQTASPGGSAASARTTAAAAPAGAQAPLAPALAVSADEVKTMIIRSDPKACSATSDASATDIALTYGKIALQFGGTLLVSKATKDAELQKSLDDFKPYLRELSRNTTWLPVYAERLIGDQIYSYNKLETYTPLARQRPLLDKTIVPMFEELKRFAAEELKSPLNFELRVVRRDQEKAPSVIAGGIVLIPSGMFAALQTVKDPEPVLAFMLAHEFSHALRRHKTKMAQLSLVDSITLGSQYKKIANTAATGFSAQKGLDQMFNFSAENVKSLMDQTCKSKNWFATMDQNQEFEADVCGALLLKKLGDRGGKTFSAVDGYKRYRDAGLSNTMTPAEEGGCTVKTGHPDPAERLQNLQSYAPGGGSGAAAAARDQ